MSVASQKKSLPFGYQFLAGAIAGISEICTFYPLDVVKTRMQLERGQSPSLVASFRNIVAQEGFGRLYKGLVPPLLLEAPKRATKCQWSRLLEPPLMPIKYSGQSTMTLGLSTLTGCSAGATESFVVVPFELVKIRLQDKATTFKGPIEVIKHILKTEGALGLYNGGYFGTIFQVKAYLPKPDSPQSRLMNDFVAGTFGGLVGTAMNTPFDVVKSRIQGAGKVPGVVPKYGWTYPSLALIAREEGLRALYKGFVPKVLRLAPGGGVLLVVVEVTLGFFRKALGPPYI
ncbi:hypothetical protein BS47DRAFT_1340564 [Hydnum rufescens UP504]|uniref:Mitochondrial carrier n=1 Tax=Hydnum rufescens UP504 TaxID=1448309 RepID=A0A9P6B340_9AGAM|nr:hypothetical protein BS47DRAFT_1340564 [Hydnum rufescens UP504]